VSIASCRDRTHLFDGEAEVLPNIVSVSLYGHTLGHTGYWVNSGEPSFLIWGDGDIVQFPKIQSHRPASMKNSKHSPSYARILRIGVWTARSSITFHSA
jgi:hypothetical protein